MSTVPLEYLFPAPSLPKSSLSPSHFPGISPRSTETLQNTLKDNHVKWHIFFNEKRFHNHAAHRAIAAWALGAEASTVQSGYEKDCGYEKPAIKSPESITAHNFEKHLGDEQYYSAYVQFFSEYVRERGVPDALEEFIFSRKANIGTGSHSGHLLMLGKFLSGVLHPMIHVGYGAEFDLPGMVVEGLAMTAVHLCPPGLLISLDLFEEDTNTLRRLSRSVSHILDDTMNATSFVDKVLSSSFHHESEGVEPPKTVATHQAELHALDILSRVLHDPQFTPDQSAKETENPFEDTINKHGRALAAYVKQWDLQEPDTDKKIEELVWTVCILFGIAGWTDCKDRVEPVEHNFNADFFFMHLVTSSIFLPAICVLLQPASQVRLLKSYFNIVLIWAVARGQPALDVKGFMSELQKSEDHIMPESVEITKNFDLWMRIIQEARGHHDEHLTKTIRSLAGWASAFGLRKARAKPNESHDETESAGLGMGSGTSGTSEKDNEVDLHPKTWRDSKNGIGYRTSYVDYHSMTPHDDDNVIPRTELPGAQYLDGGLFLRIGALTLGRMGWDKDGVKKKLKWERKDGQREEEEFWDLKGFFEQNKHCEVEGEVEGRLMAKN